MPAQINAQDGRRGWSVDLLAAVSSLTIEARHAGATGYSNDPAAKMVSPNGAFGRPIAAATVLETVKGTKFIVSSRRNDAHPNPT
jgi:hypothetical protein